MSGTTFSDPVWEAAKAARRSLAHDDAVRETDALQRQFRKLWGRRVPASPVDLSLVLRTLAGKKVPFVLSGAHGIGGWTGRPRATQDVDILVKSGRNHARAVKVIAALYPELESREFVGVTAFFVPGGKDSVLDVAYPHRADLEDTLIHPVWTENRELGIRYRVPALENALANKYGAMITLTRALAKRQQDIVDFTWMVVHAEDGNRPIDLPRLKILGEKVWPGGGEEILALVERVRSGRPIHLDSPMRGE